MRIDVNETGPLRVARVVAEADTADTDRFSEALQDLVVGAGEAVAIDLAGLRFINSSGLSALVQLVTHSRLSGGRVVLVAPSRFVREVFSITRLDQWFEICDNEQDAARRLGVA